MRRPTTDRDLDASEGGPESRGTFRRILPWALVAALAIGAFLVSLAATLPARLASEYVAAPFQMKDITGTIWAGGGGLGGGHAVNWRVNILDSVASLTPMARVMVTGPGTDLAGRVKVRGGGVAIAGLSGTAGWPLVALAAPDLDFSCDVSVDLREVTLDIAPGSYAGTGELRAGPGRCVQDDASDGEAIAVPPLLGALSTLEDGLRGILATAEDTSTALAEVLLANRGALVVTIYPEGAALVPGMPASSETILEYPLNGMLP